MKRLSFLALSLILTLIMNSCGGGAAPAVPTLSAGEIQETVVVAGFTVIAQTQAAIPTSTPQPTVTNTPLPTITLIPSPTPAGTLPPLPNANPGSGDPCINTTLPNSLQGDPVRIRLNNSTKATLSITVYLSQTVPQTVCGYRSYTIDPQQSIVISNLVEGCYTIWAWNPDPDDYFIVTNGASTCIDDSEPAVFDISTNSIKLGT